MSSKEEQNALQVASQFFKIHSDKETLTQFAQLCRNVDRGDLVVLDGMTNVLAKESIRVIFALLNMKECSSKRLSRDVTKGKVFKEGFMKTKRTCSFVGLFKEFIPSTANPQTDQSSGESRSALELDRSEWLEKRIIAPVRASEMSELVERAKSQNAMSFQAGGSLGINRSQSSSSNSSQIGPSLRETVSVHVDDDDDDDMFGPALNQSSAQRNQESRKLDRSEEWKKAEERGKQKQSVDSSLRREDWMVELPQLGLRPSLATLTDRKFSSRSEPLREQDRSLWK
jgi:hypothetical protein